MSAPVAQWQGKDGDRQWWGRDNMSLVDDLTGSDHWWKARDDLGRSAWMAAFDNQAGDGTIWNVFRRTDDNPSARAALDDHDDAGASVLAHALRHCPTPVSSSDVVQQMAWLKRLNDGQKAHRNGHGEGLLMQLHRLSVQAGQPGRWCEQGPPLNMTSHISGGADFWTEGLDEQAVELWLENGALQQVDKVGPKNGKWEANPRLLQDWLAPQYQHSPSGRWGTKLRTLLDLAVRMTRFQTINTSRKPRTPEQTAALIETAGPQISELLIHMPRDGSDIIAAALSWNEGGSWWETRKRDLEAQWLARDFVKPAPATVGRRL